MNHPALVPIVVAGLLLAACGDGKDTASTPKSTSAPPAAAVPATTYPATLAEGIVFAKPGYPEFIAKTEGISIAEPFGRWTDGPRPVIEFKEPLPKKFDLVIQGAAYGPNVGQPIKVSAGTASQEMIFDGDLSVGPQTKRISFETDPAASRIEFLIPHPTQPTNGDVRKLGIALVELKVETPPK